MVKNTVVLCALLVLFGSCSPSPRYTVDRKLKEKPPGKPTKDISARKSPPAGTKIIGIASFYAHDFHGKKTANGETYDMYGLTAAHKTWDFNTWLEVKNLSNGKTVIVRVNDRGPYVGKRIIDLSYGAAEVIGMIETGVQEVEILILR